jgi:hypothetical protein
VIGMSASSLQYRPSPPETQLTLTTYLAVY